MTTEEPRDFLGGEILCIDKPLTWTSFNAVKRLRSVIQRRLGLKKMKVGHAGTLDPLATGVMIIVTGRATKMIEQLQAGEKEYVAEVALGATTPSFDLETEIDATFPTEHITRELVEETLKQFTGRIMQVPPAFSACKVDGHRAYKTARKGGEVELAAKPLEIRELELLEYAPDKLKLRVVCSKGTYIRALARDLGTALGSGGHLTGLRRTRVGNVTIEGCMTIDEAVEMIRTCDVVMPEQPGTPTKILTSNQSQTSSI